MGRPSACLSSVCVLSLRSNHRVEVFGSIFAQCNIDSVTQAVCIKFFGKKIQGVIGKNGKRYFYNYYGKRIGTRMRSIDDLAMT